VQVRDLFAGRDHVHQGHGVTAAKAVVLGQPRDDRRRFRPGVEAVFARLLHQLSRGESGLALDRVQIGLK